MNKLGGSIKTPFRTREILRSLVILDRQGKIRTVKKQTPYANNSCN